MSDDKRCRAVNIAGIQCRRVEHSIGEHDFTATSQDELVERVYKRERDEARAKLADAYDALKGYSEGEPGECIRRLMAENQSLRGAVLRPLTDAQVVAALHEGHAERRAAEGDNAWTSLLRQRDEARASLTTIAKRNLELDAENESLRKAVAHHIAEVERLEGEIMRLRDRAQQTINEISAERDRLRDRPWERLRELGFKVDVKEDDRELRFERNDLRARLDLVEPVFDLARRWCNRPESVLKEGREVLGNDADLWRELRKRVAAAIAAGQDHPDDEPLKCCPRFSWGDGTHDLNCRAAKESDRG